MVCDKGTAAVPLTASGGASVTICGAFAAVVTDIAPGANISPFGICTLTQVLCTPTPVGQWLNPFASCLVGNAQSLLQGATLQCALGGTISIMTAAQASVLISANLKRVPSVSPPSKVTYGPPCPDKQNQHEPNCPGWPFTEEERRKIVADIAERAAEERLEEIIRKRNFERMSGRWGP